MSESKKSIVIVLGMHRSGTSCLAGSLQQMGLNLGEVHLWNPHNLKGNRENMQIVALNDEVLSCSGGSWDSPPSEIKWLTSHEKKRDCLFQELILSYNSWGFKDPRTLITFPFWYEGLKEINISSYLVGTFRSPYLVAKSLYRRNGIPYNKSFELWNLYNRNLLSIYHNFHFPLVSFDSTKSEYIISLRRVAKQLNLPQTDMAAYFFDEELRHNDHQMGPLHLPTNVRDTWDELMSAYSEQEIYGKS